MPSATTTTTTTTNDKAATKASATPQKPKPSALIEDTADSDATSYCGSDAPTLCENPSKWRKGIPAPSSFFHHITGPLIKYVQPYPTSSGNLLLSALCFPPLVSSRQHSHLKRRLVPANRRPKPLAKPHWEAHTALGCPVPAYRGWYQRGSPARGGLQVPCRRSSPT